MSKSTKKFNPRKEKISLIKYLFDSKERLGENFNIETALENKYPIYRIAPKALNPELKGIMEYSKKELIISKN